MLAYFECSPNPAGGPTLANWRGVLCDSDEHTAALPAMVFGLIVYCVGFYSMAAFVTFASSRIRESGSFVARSKFLLARWRPTSYYWGFVVVTRNLLVACAGVFASGQRDQMVYVVGMVMVYSTITGLLQPWRVVVVNRYDVVTSVLLCIVGVFGILFLSLQQEADLTRHYGGPQRERERVEDAIDGYARAMFVILILFFLSFALLICWSVSLMVPGRMEVVVQKDQNYTNALFRDLCKLGEPGMVMPAVEGAIVYKLVETERQHLRRCLDVLLQEGGANAGEEQPPPPADVSC